MVSGHRLTNTTRLTSKLFDRGWFLVARLSPIRYYRLAGGLFCIPPYCIIPHTLMHPSHTIPVYCTVRYCTVLFTIMRFALCAIHPRDMRHALYDIRHTPILPGSGRAVSRVGCDKASHTLCLSNNFRFLVLPAKTCWTIQYTTSPSTPLPSTCSGTGVAMASRSAHRKRQTDHE